MVLDDVTEYEYTATGVKEVSSLRHLFLYVICFNLIVTSHPDSDGANFVERVQCLFTCSRWFTDTVVGCVSF